MQVCTAGIPVDYNGLLSQHQHHEEENRHEQAHEPSFQRMFEENPLLALCPCDIIREGVDLDLPAIVDGCKEIEEGADFHSC